MATDTVYRLLGPSHNRLVTVIDDPDRKLGQVSPSIAATLKTLGWTRYAGTARTKAGWVIADSDASLRPRPLKAS